MDSLSKTTRSVFLPFSALVFLFPLTIRAEFLLLNALDLMKMQREVQVHNQDFEPAFLELIDTANIELTCGPYSVMDKIFTPLSGNKHDYMSLARYYWPDPNRKGGAPYIHKDCEMNPDIFSQDYDYANKNKVVRSCIRLCLAYYLTHEEKYASHAALIVRTWFLNPDSFMHPNLNFAQIIPGVRNHNHFGIIEGHTFPFLFESLNFLSGSSSWTSHDVVKMEQWAKNYLEWLLLSPNGIKARHTLNNHASWYDVQVIYFALYTHQKHLAEKFMQESTFQKLDKHFAEDYSQPHEMIRKNNFYYSLFNLQALFNCALLGEHVEKDLWERQKGKQGTLLKGLNFLLPYFEKEKRWDKGRMELIDFNELIPLLLIASTIYGDLKYLRLYEKTEGLTRDVSDATRQIPCKLLKLLYPRSFLQRRETCASP